MHSAGDRVYRRVEDVKGIFKAGVIDPYPNWADQYGMVAPWVNVTTGVRIDLDAGNPKGG